MTTVVRARRSQSTAPTRVSQRKQHLITDNLRLVYSVARQQWRPGCPIEYDDVVQTGFLALTNAARLFDPGRGLKFSTYAVSSIRNEIWKLLHPRKKKLGDPVAPGAPSMSQIPWDDAFAPRVTDHSDELAEREESQLKKHRRKLLRERVKRLEKRQSLVLWEFFGLGGRQQNQEELGQVLGVTDSTVGNIRRSGLAELRKRLERVPCGL